MTTYIPAALRQLVYDRAKGKCEYCLYNELYTIQPHEIDHIYAEKHGGETIESNLCLYHPRNDLWSKHFRLDDALILPLDSIGRVTVRLLRFNEPVRIHERERLISLGRYP